MHPNPSTKKQAEQSILADLYMLRLRFHVGKLFNLGRQRRLPLEKVDSGYLVHCQMDELFGDNSPRPFSIQHESERFFTILAYSGRTEENLIDHAQTYADPSIFRGCDWENVSSKKMPDNWKKDTIVGFQVRCIPTVTSRDENNKKCEIDSFKYSCINAPPNQESLPGREQVYNQWLAKNIYQHSSEGAVLLNSRLERYQLNKLLRRKGPPERRTSTTVTLPDVTMTGHIRITDPTGFAALLKRGVGKHLPFGYGMLLLKPPET